MKAIYVALCDKDGRHIRHIAHINERDVIRKEAEMQIKDDPRHGMQSAIEALLDKQGLADAIRQELEQ